MTTVLKYTSMLDESDLGENGEEWRTQIGFPVQTSLDQVDESRVFEEVTFRPQL